MGPPAAPGHNRCMRGHTLIELLFVLLLAAVGASSLVPTARKVRTWAVLSSARETLVAGFTGARATAVRHGYADLIIRSSPPAYRVESPVSPGSWVPLADPPLRLELDGDQDSITVRFDRMGVARFASHSIDVVVGSASSGLVVSSYGRIRRR